MGFTKVIRARRQPKNIQSLSTYLGCDFLYIIIIILKFFNLFSPLNSPPRDIGYNIILTRMFVAITIHYRTI